MKPMIKNILIAFIIILCVVGIYYYFFNNKSNKNLGTLISSNSDSVSGVSTKINEDTAFLSTLIGLSGIKIDTAIFTSQTFSSLVDNYVPVNSTSEGIPGRVNPFASIEVILVPEIIPVGTPANNSLEVAPVSNTNSVLNRLLNSSNSR